MAARRGGSLQYWMPHHPPSNLVCTLAGWLDAGMYLDPSLGAAMPLLAAHQLSPEDAAVLQAMPGGVAGLAISSGLPPHLATAAHGGVMPLDAAALAAQAHAAAAVAGGPGAGAGPSGDAAAAAAALHAQAEAQMQLLQAHAVEAGHSPSDGAAVGGEGSSASAPKKDRQFWSQQEQQDLLQLATDPAHRQASGRVAGTGAGVRAGGEAQRLGRGAVESWVVLLLGVLLVRNRSCTGPAVAGAHAGLYHARVQQQPTLAAERLRTRLADGPYTFLGQRGPTLALPRVV